jgi:hypothetical protein
VDAGQVVAIAVYVVAYLAAGPALARAWRANRITRGQFALLRAMRWASIPLYFFALDGSLLTPVALTIVIGAFLWSLALYRYFLPRLIPEQPEP